MRRLLVASTGLALLGLGAAACSSPPTRPDPAPRRRAAPAPAPTPVPPPSPSAPPGPATLPADLRPLLAILGTPPADNAADAGAAPAAVAPGDGGSPDLDAAYRVTRRLAAVGPRDPRVIPTLARCLEGPPSPVTFLCASALARIGRPALATIRRALRDDNPGRRALMANALGQSGGEEPYLVVDLYLDSCARLEGGPPFLQPAPGERRLTREALSQLRRHPRASSHALRRRARVRHHRACARRALRELHPLMEQHGQR